MGSEDSEFKSHRTARLDFSFPGVRRRIASAHSQLSKPREIHEKTRSLDIVPCVIEHGLVGGISAGRGTALRTP